MASPVTTEVLDGLRLKHKRIAHLKSARCLADGKTPEWEFVIKSPNRSQYKQFRSQVHDEKRKAEATEILVRQLIIYPDPTEFDQMMEDWPALCDGCGGTLNALAGAEQVEAGKL
jgi:hypothetical protein